jgi:hypothetical protein
VVYVFVLFRKPVICVSPANSFVLKPASSQIKKGLSCQVSAIFFIFEICTDTHLSVGESASSFVSDRRFALYDVAHIMRCTTQTRNDGIRSE